MVYSSAVDIKNQQVPAYYDAQQCGAKPSPVDTFDGGSSPYRPPTMREQAEKQIGYHREQADKLDRTAAFFRENPAFDEFIQLVRSGAIQF